MKSEPYTTGNQEIDAKIEELIKVAGITADSNRFKSMITTVINFAADQPRRADIKQMDTAIRELREAERIFTPYDGNRIITIFGSARTPPHAPAYQMAHRFAQSMRDVGYMTITGGGEGIMGAAQAGAGRDRSFALNIDLPFEQYANETIRGDSKLITFKYFFTRKVNFVKHSNAFAMFPGGFGTMDETFEVLTLMQTGKAQIVPVIFIDEPGGTFWSAFEEYLRNHLLKQGLISEDDFHLMKFTRDIDNARDEVQNFYKNFHSYRYVRDLCVMRMLREMPATAIAELNREFKDLIVSGDIANTAPLSQEVNEPEIAHLPRIRFHVDRHKYGRLRLLINRINEF